MALHLSFEKECNQILLKGNSSVKEVILNRPRKLNSLNYQMFSEIGRALKSFENDPAVQLVILKANGRAFCAGGDVVAVIGSSLLGHWSFAARIYRRQLHLDCLIATYKKPLVCLINGAVMGGGAGLSMNARFRIVTERAVFAMPEASIGHIPDVGASYFLSRLPGYFGEYLGLTGARLNGAEMVVCGLATHFIPSKDIELLEHELLALGSSNSSSVTSIIEKFADKSYAVKNDSPCKRLEIINKCFSRETVEEILHSLEDEKKIKEEKWIVQALNFMKSSSPTSLKIFLRLVREGRTLNLVQCLLREYNVGVHIIKRSFNNDIYEGSRARLFDKDYKPKWEPATLELVSEKVVEQYFSRADEEDLEPLELSRETSNLLNKFKSKL